MKKILCFALSAALAVTMGVGGLTPAKASAAEKKDSKNASATALKLEKKKTQKYKEGEALVLFKATETASTRAKAKKALGLGSGFQVSNIWNFDGVQEASVKADKKTAAGKTSGSSSNIRVALIKSDSLSTKELIRKLKLKDNVELAEPNYQLKALGTNDTYFKKQWAMENTGQNGGTAGKSIHAAAKWDKGIKGSKNVIAIVDTGVDYTHEDLKDNIWENTYQPELKGEHGFDFINGDDDPMDDNGHGSHCAGIIGAKGDNKTGVTGVNQEVNIMALKILDESGSGWGADEVGAYHYINKALDLGVKVVAINNSWGGGESSQIFEKLMDLVGQKGAVSVCAAGNESGNNDETGEFPSNIESPYKLSVAASNEKNQLTDFSNYGKRSVDLAAPGADILSTVAYDCYNPSLYDADVQKTVSQGFNDYEGDSGWAIPEESAFEASGSCAYTAETTSEQYFGDGASGKALKLSFKNMKKSEYASVRIPYTLSEDISWEDMPYFSVMAKVRAPETNESIFAMADVPKGTDIGDPEDFIFDYECYGTYVTGEQNYWNHYGFLCGGYEEKPEKERELILLVQAGSAGDMEVYLDDLGLSVEKPDTTKFGKYDFYNGTSMAAPAVTGAIGLAAAEYPDADSQDRINYVLSSVQKEDGLADKVAAGGVLDLSKNIAVGPRIGTISVDPSKKQIVIKGSGFDTEGLKVTIDGVGAEVVSKSKKQVIIKDQGWINNLVSDITIEGKEGLTATKNNVYLVKGKTAYTELEDLEFPYSADALTTDGRNLYCADSSMDSIQVLDTADSKYMEFAPILQVQAEKLFKKNSSSEATFDFTFGKDLVYMDGKLYNIAAYSEVHTSVGGDVDDDWSFFAEEEEESGPSDTAYSSQYKLISLDPNTGKTASLGALPSALKRTDDWTLAAYNGKLYLIGGYDYSKKEVSKRVMIYDPSSKKWSDGPALPEGRAAGKAIQSGNKLVYTLGYSAGQKGIDPEKQSCPKNLILDGGKWKTSSGQILPYYAGDKRVRSGSTYQVYSGSIGLCADGIAYMGLPAEGLGDTFTYNISKDRFTATKYHHITELNSKSSFTGTVVGSALYGYDEEGSGYTAKLSSGLVKVTAPKMKGGSIEGANQGFLPGNTAILKVKARPGYFAKSLKVDGKTVKGKTKKIRMISNHKASAAFGKYVSKIKLNKKKVTLKAGNTFKLKVKVLPSDASSKKVTYKSSNKKYATVSAKGVIKAKKAGIGKTVTITIKAKDGSKKTAKCKVKIVDKKTSK